MSRVFLYLIVLALAASLALPLAQISSATNVTVRHTVIAATGDEAPSGGNYLPFSFSNARLNTRHEVTFEAVVGGPSFATGIFVGDGNTTSTVALGPDTVTNPYITPNGNVVFDVNSIDISSSDGKSIVPLMRDGAAAPGGGTLTLAGGPRATNDHGAIAYVAFINGSTATQGIFRADGNQTVTIARDDISAPAGESFTLLGTPVINDRGQVAFFSELSAGFGIFRGEGGDLTPVFVTNQIAPGGATFADFGEPSINNHGQVIASASLTNSTIHSGLFVGDGTNATAIALQQQPAPKGGSYNGNFFGHIKLSDRGEAAFNAGLTGGTSTSGIFRGNGENTTTIALRGANAPGTTGTFASFRDYVLLNDGRIAFIATLTLGVGGVNTSNNMGIWIGTSEEDLQLVVRTGDVIGGRVLTRLPEAGVGNQFDMNENGVLWVGTFGVAKAVVYSRVLGDGDNT
ncbi:MAG TPA: choice-of-anchor tandem repeat NxxGxxAF-containing protein [Pyrinomonadaceae bacterium]|nr:choice-of-anchor tandem repeat NxxGxxAF-containing protein [Pyrinomonadaceae bacterium]